MRDWVVLSVSFSHGFASELGIRVSGLRLLSARVALCTLRYFQYRLRCAIRAWPKALFMILSVSTSKVFGVLAYGGTSR